MRPHVITVLLSAGAVAAYFGYRALSDHGPEALEETAGTAAESEAGAPLVDSLPEFVLDDLAGNPTSISSWPGKPLLVNFWATWCAPCLREIPMLKTYQDDNPGTQVVGIAIDRVAPVVAFAEDMQFNYPVLVGPEAMNAAGAFGVDFVAMPFSVFTAADGSVLGVHTGELHAEHLERFSGVLEDLGTGTIDTAAARAIMAGRM